MEDHLIIVNFHLGALSIERSELPVGLRPRVELQDVSREVGPRAPGGAAAQVVRRHELRAAVARRRREQSDAVRVARPQQPAHRAALDERFIIFTGKFASLTK